jgi:hypothetical protein
VHGENHRTAENQTNIITLCCKFLLFHLGDSRLTFKGEGDNSPEPDFFPHVAKTGFVSFLDMKVRTDTRERQLLTFNLRNVFWQTFCVKI